tara:strand:+ start:560 stop:1951 length:1392 start_codon:yes stop_codon:yes gene_type:complete
MEQIKELLEEHEQHPIDFSNVAMLRGGDALEDEQNLLAMCLCSVSAAERAASALDVDSFMGERHQQVFEAIVEALGGDVCDGSMSTEVSERMDAAGVLGGTGGIKYLIRLEETALPAAYAKQYIDRVKVKSDKRKAQQFLIRAYELSKRDGSNEQILSLLDQARSYADAMDNTEPELEVDDSASKDIFDVLKNLSDAMETGIVDTGVQTPWKMMNYYVNGMRAGDLWVVGGRPSEGKSVMGMNLATGAASDGHNTLFFSLEMSKAMVAYRMLASLCSVPLHELRRADKNIVTKNMSRMVAKANELHGMALEIADPGCRTVSQIYNRTKEYIKKHGGVDLVVIDYLQLAMVDQKAPNIEQETAWKSAAFKRMAVEFDCVVVALAQLSRDGTKAGRRPRLDDLRGSGTIEQDADGVLMIHRPDGKEKPKATIYVEKNRNGELGHVDMVLIGKHCRFEEEAKGGWY